MFYDEVTVRLKAGNGGDGCLSFRREKYIPKGGPNGGDGGKGGDVILQCDPNVSDLTKYRYKPNWKAGNGEPGKGSDKNGAKGQNLILPVPPGTLVYGLETQDIVAELLNPGDQVTLIRGGQGGLGNVHFKSPTNRAPRQTTPGDKIDEQEFKFVLKVIADIGLVGFPNAGKSTLTNTITNAHPKMAPYPFTTKIPNIGVIQYQDEMATIKMADIPGLIDGASQNKGLGHRFLRHIERCRLLLFLIDMAAIDQRNPIDDYNNLLNELSLYDPKLLQKPRIVAANKMDLPDAKDNYNAFLKQFGNDTPIYPISCQNNLGIDLLLQDLLKHTKSL